MGTGSDAKNPPSTLLIWALAAAAGLFSIALLPRDGAGGRLAAALAGVEAPLLTVLGMTGIVPWIRRSAPGCVVQACLGLAALALVVAGSVGLVALAWLGAGRLPLR